MYPHAHNLGSRDWVSREREIEPPLGEWAGERTKYSGKPPLRVPLPILVGEPHCIEFGERPGLPIIPDVSAACAKPSPDACYAAADLFLDLTDVYDCVFAKASVDIIAEAYEDIPAAVAAVTTFLGFFVGSVTGFEQLGELLPAGVIAKVNNTALLWLTGTTNETQLAVQALLFGSTPVSQGEYSTTVLYEEAALYIADRLNEAGCGACDRFVLMGHSYGGAVVQVLAAKMTIADPVNRRIELMTFGASQPGDQRLHDLVANLRQTHYANERDPIPYLPPKGFNLASIGPTLIPALRLIWQTFKRPPNQTMITRDGQLLEVETDLLPDDTMRIAALLLSQGFEIPKFKDHGLNWYSYYLCLACACVARPCIEPPDDLLVFELQIEGLEVTVDGNPIVYNYSNRRSNANGVIEWDWLELPVVRAVVETSALYPGVYGDVHLYFLGGVDIEHGVEFNWHFPAALDVINKGLTTATIEDVACGWGAVLPVSLERLRITPILL